MHRKPPRRDGWRLRVARTAARAATAASRATGLGAGSSIGGRVALAVMPQILPTVAAGRVLAVVSGTNGKTTTTRLLATAAATRRPVLCNSSGANLPSGLVTVLCAERRSPAVLEVDELYLAPAVEALRPRVVVLLNLSRDQLDRTMEAQRTAALWRAALTPRGGAEPVVVANCDDPRVVWAASAARDVVWVSTGLEWSGDSHVCPRCGGPLRHDPQWACGRCGMRRPEPAAGLDGHELWSAAGRLHVDLDLPGRANRADAVLAAVAATHLGVPPGEALAAMRGVREVEGRYTERHVDGVPCRLLLAKNPASWAATLDIVGADDRPLLLSLNAHVEDGRDTSWIYDVPFERLAGRRLAVTGDAAADLSLRLGYAGVRHDVRPDPRTALAELAAVRPVAIDAIGDYSGFQRLRRLQATA